MKRLIIATMLALFSLIPNMASAEKFTHLTTNPLKIMSQDFDACTPERIQVLPTPEIKWIGARFTTDKYIQEQLASRLELSVMRSKFMNTIHHDKKMIKINYGKPGYEELKMSLLITREELDSANHELNKNPSLSTCVYITHAEKMLAYRYQHHDYSSHSEKVAALAKQAAENNRLSALFGHQIGERVIRHWQVVFSPNLHCLVRIELSPQGHLEGTPAITQPSGNAKFDSAVISAIEAAAPFPPPIGLSYSEFKVVNIVFSAKELSNG